MFPAPERAGPYSSDKRNTKMRSAGQDSGALLDVEGRPARPHAWPGTAGAAWAEAVRRAERGESVPVIAHGDHIADIVPFGELDRLRETIEVLSDTELVRDLREGLADARAGRVFSAGEIAADLAARRAAGR